MNRMNFTKQSVTAIKISKNGRVTYHDQKEQGLSLYITQSGVKTFFIRKRINGRDEKIIIGRFPDISIEQARKEAQKIKGAVAGGVNPNIEKQKLKKELTLKELFETYLDRYAKHHKKTWEYDEKQFNRYLSNWQFKKISIITRLDIEKLHKKVGNENGIYAANRLLAFLKTLFNKANQWGWEGVNPALYIKKYKEKSRDRFLQPEELPKFFKELENETNQSVKDYIWLSILTGARKTNVLSMRWDEIDFRRKIWHIPETKNGESLDIPLVDEAISILKNRKGNKNEWVFASATSSSGHLEEPKRVWRGILQRAGIKDFRLHDLRRTLGSYQAITGASLQIIGKTLGHKSQQATQVYSRLKDDPVRGAMDKAIDEILKIGSNS